MPIDFCEFHWMDASFEWCDVRCGGRVGASLLSGSLQSLFFCEYEANKLVSFVALLHYLDHGSVTRRAFDLDVVCHVGEMIPAPADV